MADTAHLEECKKRQKTEVRRDTELNLPSSVSGLPTLNISAKIKKEQRIKNQNKTKKLQ